jgi:hypothetical protein
VLSLMVCAQIGLVEGTKLGTIAPKPDVSAEEFDGTPLEWVGLDREVTYTDIALLDEKLGLAAVTR